MKLAVIERLRDESGVAMIIILIGIVIVSVLGAGLIVSATRDLESSTSVGRASSALGVAEAAVQHAIQQIKVLGPTKGRLGLKVPDKSIDSTSPGEGLWMNPANPAVPPPLADQFVGEVGATDRYTAYVTEIDPINLAAFPPDRDGIFRIVATGLDRKDSPTRPGARTVEQVVRVRTLDVPFSLFAKSGADGNGQQPIVLNESFYTLGDMFWRSKITIDGQDDFYGGPAAAHAAGVIYKGNGGGGVGGPNGPIHPPEDNCDYPYDRDNRGKAYAPFDPGPPGSWGCSPLEVPPYTSSYFDATFFEDLGINTEGPDEDTYQFLKQLAQSSGYYRLHDSSSTLTIQSADLAGMPNFFVLYVDITGGGQVALKSGWGPQVIPPENSTCPPPPAVGDYKGEFGIIVIRGGDLEWQNNENWWGAAFVPEGEFHATGNGQYWFVGTVYADTIYTGGTAKYQLNDCWKSQAVGPFYVVSRLRWHEGDR